MFRQLLDEISPEIKKYVQKQGEIAAQIAEILTARNMTQKELAQQLNMKESQLSKILAGNANLTLRTITKIESALGVDVIQIPMFASKTNFQYTIELQINQSEKFSSPFDPHSYLPFSSDRVATWPLSLKDPLISYHQGVA